MIKISPAETAGMSNPESPAELLLIGPMGKRTGYDQKTKRDLTEIEDSYYDHYYIEDTESGEPGPEFTELYAPRPLTGDYQLQVIGKWKGAYSLGIRAYDREINDSGKDFENVMIRKGEKHVYRIHFVKEDAGKTEIFRKDRPRTGEKKRK